MARETYLQTRRRLGLPDIPQELLDEFHSQLELEEQRRRDPEWIAEQEANYEAVLAQLQRKAR
ncbi:hypothetical protein Cme02nite_52240 [Catellatospora methionotrophica]|uniref:Uncharacterized protein n=1 Tax=Catellatospora methionotrophica TaxID=121620 RepID=A0A8J3PH20_9ACTN|nr:hypothetical protein [Catellatospora methionotrophica]GIG16892.1 hypothetical protein Cme02nite_52240 [Catellatospora methionotrophica]